MSLRVQTQVPSKLPTFQVVVILAFCPFEYDFIFGKCNLLFMLHNGLPYSVPLKDILYIGGSYINTKSQCVFLQIYLKLHDQPLQDGDDGDSIDQGMPAALTCKTKIWSTKLWCQNNLNNRREKNYL